MTRTLITIHTDAYRRIHGRRPRQTPAHERTMWAFCFDDDEAVVVKYGTYTEALSWARGQARQTITVLP